MKLPNALVILLVAIASWVVVIIALSAIVLVTWAIGHLYSTSFL